MTDASMARQEHVPTERDASSGASPDRDERPFLIVRVDERLETVELAPGAEVLVGRIDDAAIVVAHPSVSRRHAVIRLRDGALTVEDLGTINGTRVNRVALFGVVRSIAPGDLVTVGPAEIAVALTTQPRRNELVGSGRLEQELARAGADDALVLARLADRPEARAALAELADEVIASDAQAEGEIVALLTAAGAEALGARQAASPELATGAAFARYPSDGATVAELLAHVRAVADEEPVDASGSVLVADPAMIKVFQLARRVAATSMNVLLTGETGAGKEVVAEAIHAASPRAGRPFVRLNCGAIPAALLESELFGHERGAFTGATRRKVGYFEAAADGTLLLDEIGELDVALQAKLLRVLEGRRLSRVGGTEEIDVAARVVFATHKDLKDEVRRGAFREDLFYRIAGFTIRVPPLRERPSEIALLAEHFAARLVAATGGAPVKFDKTAITALKNYPWPGNVRELRNAVEHAVVMSSGGVVRASDLPEGIAEGPREIPKRAVRTELEAVERERIARALADEGDNRTYAARRLGMSRRALLYKIAKYGLGRG